MLILKTQYELFSENLRQESRGRCRVKGIPGFVATSSVENIKNEDMREIILKQADKIAITSKAIADDYLSRTPMFRLKFRSSFN